MSEPDEATKSVMAAMLLEDRLNAEDAGGVETGDPDSDSDYGAQRRRPPGMPPATLSPQSGQAMLGLSTFMCFGKS